MDFVHRITAEIKTMQAELASLHRAMADLQSGIRLEQNTRESDVARVHDRISQERAAETQMRGALERRQEEFESKAKTWVGALGKDCVATKEQLMSLDSVVAERATRQAAADNRRFMDLEAAMPTKSTVVQMQRVEEDVALLKTQLEHDHAAANEAVKSAMAAAAYDFTVAQDSISGLQTYTEAAKKALAAEVSSLTSKLETLEAFAQTRANAADLQALEPHVYEAERALERLGHEVTTKASVTTVNSISERLSHVTMDIQANEAQHQVDHEATSSKLSTIEKGVEKNARQLDSDRERTSNCVVALEKELNLKASRAETDLIGPTTLQAAVDHMESRSLDLEKHIAVTRQELVPFRNRVEALETAFPTKADAAEIPKLSLAIADQNGKHEALYRRTHEHEMRLEKLDSHVNRHTTKLEAVESRSIVLDQKISTKAESTEHFTKDHTTDLLRDFYRREEIDAMMSRVWWRVGDMNKGRLTTNPQMVR